MIPSRRAAPYAWLVGALLAVSVAAALYVVTRSGAQRAPSTAAAPTAPPEPTVKPSPTAGVDEIVVAPRILNETPSVTAPPPAPTLAPTQAPRPLPTPEPTAAPLPQALLLPNGRPLTERVLHRWIDDWTAKPIDLRAHEAVRIAHIVKYWIAAHPGEPFTAELAQMLPRTLKDDASTAQSSHRPGLAAEFLVAYMQLNPDDPDVADRLTKLRERIRNRNFPNR